MLFGDAGRESQTCGTIISKLASGTVTGSVCFLPQQEKRCSFARGLREDLERRLPHYISDYKDGVVGHKTVQKVVSTTFFLYFACILPAIAFGVLNDHNTHGKIGRSGPGV